MQRGARQTHAAPYPVRSTPPPATARSRPMGALKNLVRARRALTARRPGTHRARRRCCPGRNAAVARRGRRTMLWVCMEYARQAGSNPRTTSVRNRGRPTSRRTCPRPSCRTQHIVVDAWACRTCGARRVRAHPSKVGGSTNTPAVEVRPFR